MNIIEKLGMRKIERRYNPLLNLLHYYEDDIRDVEKQRDEMLEALIDLTLFIEEEYYMRLSNRKKDYPLDGMNAIESATGKTWAEIKELI